MSDDLKRGELVEFYTEKTRRLGLVLKIRLDDIFSGTDKICDILTSDGKKVSRLVSGLRRFRNE